MVKRDDMLLAAALALGAFNLLSVTVALTNVAADRDAAYAQVAELTDANRQWVEFDKRRVEAIAHWEQQAAVYADRLAGAEEAHAALLQEREAWVWRVTHAEARTPFDAGFIRWAIDRNVTHCESTDNPRAQNGAQWGLFQIATDVHAGLIASMGFTPAQMLEPLPNVMVAERLYRGRGADHWPTCGKR